tara:strand:+ start:25192 stop:25389 length:198 start_codon:yes stop_codon:yes gene_type:complete
MTKTFETDYGTVTVCNAMFDIDGTNLEEGIEIKGEGFLIENYGWRYIDEMTVEDVEELIEKEHYH